MLIKSLQDIDQRCETILAGTNAAFRFKADWGRDVEQEEQSLLKTFGRAMLGIAAF